MNTRAVRALVRRDLRRAVGSKPVLIPLVAVPALLLVILPAAIGLLPPTGEDADIDRLLTALPPAVTADLPTAPGARLAAVMLVYLLAPLYLMVPVVVATVIAADSFAGERERGTLEVLLTAPVTDTELFVAKLLGAFLPALATGLGGAVVYGTVANLTTGEPLFPNLLWVGLALWLGPGIAAAGLGVVVLVSSRVRGFQEANQLGGLVVLPVVGLVVAQGAGSSSSPPRSSSCSASAPGRSPPPSSSSAPAPSPGRRSPAASADGAAARRLSPPTGGAPECPVEEAFVAEPAAESPLEPADRVEVLRSAGILVLRRGEAGQGGGDPVGDPDGRLDGSLGDDLAADEPPDGGGRGGETDVPRVPAPRRRREEEGRPLADPELAEDWADLLGEVLDVLALDETDRAGHVAAVGEGTVDDDELGVGVPGGDLPLERPHAGLDAEPELLARLPRRRPQVVADGSRRHALGSRRRREEAPVDDRLHDLRRPPAPHGSGGVRRTEAERRGVARLVDPHVRVDAPDTVDEDDVGGGVRPRPDGPP